MTLDQAISEVSHITSDPLHIQRVSHALSNKVYKVTSGYGSYGLRINNPSSTSLGIDRRNEASLLKMIEKQTWSPNVEYISSTVLLTRWYQQSSTIDSTGFLSNTMNLLTSVHQFPVLDANNLKTLNVAEHISKYLAHIKTPLAFKDAVTNFCSRYRIPEDKVLCHHDWHRGNLIQTKNELILLDWEYAALGDPLIDIACFINGLQLKEPDIQLLTQKFNLNRERLQQTIALTELMSFVWYMVRFPNKDWTEQIQNWISRLK